MICEFCEKNKVISVTHMRLSDREEPKDYYVCEECLQKIKKKKA
jgi:protein-arginine kinase activator protein McsA